MKKIIFVLSLFAFFFVTSADAQIYVLRSSAGAVDSVTNTGSVTMTARVPGDGARVAIQATFVKGSGTPGGIAILYGTVDGVHYAQISTDTLTVTNVTSGSKIWVIEGHPCTSYQVKWTGSGTSQYAVSGQVLRRLK